MSLPDIYRQYTAFSLMRLFDLTQLTESKTRAETVASSAIACEGGPPAATCVCALPAEVKSVKQMLLAQQQKGQTLGQQQRLSAALNYPDGKKSAEEVSMEAVSALKDGADEFECLIDWGAMNANVADGENRVRLLISEVKKVVMPVSQLMSAWKWYYGIRQVTPHVGLALISDYRCYQVVAPRVVRAVLEVGKLSGGDIISRAGIAALEGGADFLQTSSGLEPDQTTFFAVHLLSVALDEYAKRAKQEAQWNPSVQDPRKIGIKVDIGPNGTQIEAANYLMQIIYEKGLAFVNPSTFRIGGSEKLLQELKDAAAAYVPPDTTK